MSNPYFKPIELTQEQLDEQRRLLDSCKYYGIPTGIWDGDSQEYTEHEWQIKIDRDAAELLIMKKQQIPKDLEERLLQYKKEDEMKKACIRTKAN